MKGKYTNFIICSLTLFCLIEIFDHTKLLINTFYEATYLWFFNLIPTLFPFFIITDILANYGFIDVISKISGRFMHFFKLPKIASYPLFMSMFSGFPGNSKLIKDLLDKKAISEDEANKLLTFTHFSNPLFIIGTIGLTFLNNKKIGFIILFIHFVTNFILGFLFRNIYQNLHDKVISIKKEAISFTKLLSESINHTINTLFLIYGIIIFFALFVNILSINLNLNPFNKAILTGLLEMTQGLKQVSNLSLSINIKATIMTFFISFGGFSIHMQVMSILANYKINYFTYFLARIIHACISSLLVFYLLRFIG